jgi:hypothetical protein
MPQLANAYSEDPTGNKNPARIVAADELNNKDMETPIVLPDKKRAAKHRTTEPPTTAAPPTKTEPVKTAPKTPTRPSESFTMSKGHYYVVVGVYSVMSHSMKFTKEIVNKGL